MAEKGQGIVAVICCVDPLVQPGVFRWAMEKFGEGNFTLLAARAPTLSIIEDKEPAYEHIIDELYFISDKLGLREITIVSHSDCKAWTDAGLKFTGPGAIEAEESFHRDRGEVAIQQHLLKQFEDTEIASPMLHHYYRKDLQQMVW